METDDTNNLLRKEFPKDRINSFACSYSRDSTQEYTDILKIAERAVNEAISEGATSVKLSYHNILDANHNPEGKVGRVRTIGYKHIEDTPEP
jgi:hypothetical protein